MTSSSSIPLAEKTARRVKVLNVLGIRAAESSMRSKLTDLTEDTRRTNTRRHVDTWHPIFHWSEDQVWDYVKTSQVPYYWAYDKGMPRLSCSFCIFAPQDVLLLAGHLRPDMLAEYAKVEQETGINLRRRRP